MNKQIFQSSRLREQYTKIAHKSGLDIYVFPKQLTTTYAFFAVKYGAVDTRFRLAGAQEYQTVPDGVAHFLEHKLFDNANGTDSIEAFTRLGADANAYTSHHRTAYLFSCTERIEEALAELLTFVTHPHFTEQSVHKEQGIIAQEIRMGDDHPGNRRFYQLLRAMYPCSRVYTPICGTVESIAQITPQLLYACHSAFYQLSNMALVVCGPVDADAVAAVADRVLAADEPVAIEREPEQTDDAVVVPMLSCRMDVAKPIFTVGIKDVLHGLTPTARASREVAASILCEIMFNQSSPLYTALYREGLITGGMGYAYDISPSYAFISVSGESPEPETVLARIRAALDAARAEGLDKALFHRYKRGMYADFVRNFDSTAEIADLMLDCIFDGIDPFSLIECIEAVDFADVTALLEDFTRPERFALSVVYPKED